jgi:hypothetical protein
MIFRSPEPFGTYFGHVRLSDLLLVNHHGEVVQGNKPVNAAAFAIHSQIHQARPDVMAATHAHSLLYLLNRFLLASAKLLAVLPDSRGFRVSSHLPWFRPARDSRLVFTFLVSDSIEVHAFFKRSLAPPLLASLKRRKINPSATLRVDIERSRNVNLKLIEATDEFTSVRLPV